jgi:hypothetical protein
MAHKPECAKSKDANAMCDKDCEKAETRFCNSCGQEIGANEKECPKCKENLEAADEEDSLVERSLKRIANKNKRKKPSEKKPDDKKEKENQRYKSPGLAKLFKKKEKK